MDFLEQVLLQEIHRLTRFASCYEDDFLEIIVGRSAAAAADEQAKKKRELQTLTARDKELDILFERMYEDDTDWNGDEPLDYGAVL